MHVPVIFDMPPIPPTPCAALILTAVHILTPLYAIERPTCTWK